MQSQLREIQIKILLNLEDRDLIHYCQVNQKAWDICQDQNFWYQKVAKLLDGLTREQLINYKSPNRPWHQYYISLATWQPRRQLRTLATEGKLDKVALLLSRGVSVYGEDEMFQHAPLQRAAENGKLDVVKYLISKGESFRDFNGVYSLIWASRNGHLDVVKYIISQGVNPNNWDTEEYNPGNVLFRDATPEVREYLVSVFGR